MLFAFSVCGIRVREVFASTASARARSASVTSRACEARSFDSTHLLQIRCEPVFAKQAAQNSILDLSVSLGRERHSKAAGLAQVDEGRLAQAGLGVFVSGFEELLVGTPAKQAEGGDRGSKVVDLREPRGGGLLTESAPDEGGASEDVEEGRPRRFAFDPRPQAAKPFLDCAHGLRQGRVAVREHVDRDDRPLTALGEQIDREVVHQATIDENATRLAQGREEPGNGAGGTNALPEGASIVDHEHSTGEMVPQM